MSGRHCGLRSLGRRLQSLLTTSLMMRLLILNHIDCGFRLDQRGANKLILSHSRLIDLSRVGHCDSTRAIHYHSSVSLFDPESRFLALIGPSKTRRCAGAVKIGRRQIVVSHVVALPGRNFTAPSTMAALARAATANVS